MPGEPEQILGTAPRAGPPIKGRIAGLAGNSVSTGKGSGPGLDFIAPGAALAGPKGRAGLLVDKRHGRGFSEAWRKGAGAAAASGQTPPALFRLAQLSPTQLLVDRNPYGTPGSLRGGEGGDEILVATNPHRAHRARYLSRRLPCVTAAGPRAHHRHDTFSDQSPRQGSLPGRAETRNGARSERRQGRRGDRARRPRERAAAPSAFIRSNRHVRWAGYLWVISGTDKPSSGRARQGSRPAATASSDETSRRRR